MSEAEKDKSKSKKKKHIVKRMTKHMVTGSHSVDGKPVDGQPKLEELTESFGEQSDSPLNLSFMLMGNLFHVDGLKSVQANAKPGEITVETDSGKVTIKCPTVGAYVICKDDKGVAIGRVMTQEEFDKYSQNFESMKPPSFNPLP